MKYIHLIILLICCQCGLTQSILNGSFEGNTLSYSTSFHYGFTSESFSSVVQNAYGISENDTLKLGIKKGLAYEGNWSLVMYKQLIGDDYNYKNDYVAMKLTEPLVQGQMYSISFYIKKYNIYQFPNTGPTTIDFPIRLKIGYSSDSTSGGVEVFQSEMPTSFDDWEYQNFQFKCYHTNINYITIGLGETSFCGPRYTCQVDFFNFSYVTDTDEYKKSTLLYPNPTAQGLVHLQHPKASQVLLHDLMGKEKFRYSLKTQQKNTLLIEHLPRGVYMLSLWHEGKMLRREKLMKL